MNPENKKCYNYAVYLLSKRDYCTFELNKKLNKKEFSSHSIEFSLNELKSQNYLNDQRYLEGRVRHYLRNKKGSNYIFQKCEALKLSPTQELIDETARELQINTEDHILHHIKKKLLSLKVDQKKVLPYIEKQRIKNKIILYLSSKGYRVYDITSYLRELNYEI